MKRKILFLSLLLPLLFSCLSSGYYDFRNSDEPFSFWDLRRLQTQLDWPVEFREMSDGVKVAYRRFTVPDPRASVVFYHGGGAHGGAGYIDFCRSLSENSSANIYLIDMRGHGQSGGPRGDGPSKRRFLKDMREMIDTALGENPGIPLYMAGHSSGAGLLLNFASSRFEDDIPAGYFFFAPWFGVKSRTERSGDDLVFVDRDKWPIVLNRLTLGAAYGHHEALTFSYPRSRAEREAPVVTRNSVNTARAVTPPRPESQLNDINGRCVLWIGEDDEVLDVKKLLWFYRENAPDSEYHVREDYKHISLMLDKDIALPID